MKYTKSKDGVVRCNVTVKLRFTREEYEALIRYGKKYGSTPQEVCHGEASLALEGLVWELVNHGDRVM